MQALRAAVQHHSLVFLSQVNVGFCNLREKHNISSYSAAIFRPTDKWYAIVIGWSPGVVFSW
jgi:hypothetical protein